MKIKSILKIVLSVLALNFLSLEIHAQQEKELISIYLKNELAKNNWKPGDINDWIISDQYTDKSTGLTHIYIQQRHHQVVVYNAISVFLIRENKIVYFKSGIIDHLHNKVNSDRPAIGAETAIRNALRHMEKSDAVNITRKSEDASLNKFIFDAPEISSTPVKVQLVYRETEKNILLAWDVSIELKDEPHWWNIRIDALTGAFIDQNDFTKECMFAIPDYRVFPFPTEAPNFGGRALLTDPSDPTASPYGWHDVNGIAGEEFTITRGNNVYSYEDANNDNQPGYSPDGGINLHFDFPFLPNPPPLSNRDASLTNLFYVNNAIHDYLYPLGFTEASGNFQQNNYGNGGLGNDYVKAEGFDGSGTNNANFSTPSDGFSGRMQMYLWSANASVCSSLNVSSSTYTGPMTVATAQFSSVGSVTANLILAVDGSAPVNDGCSSITNNVSGKIALIDRGLCNFINKAQAAQAAGAVGVIIANNVAGSPPSMPGSPNVSIPCVSVSLADGNTLKTALQNGNVTATITTCTGNQIDGSFDNGIVAHEYGHGLSTRLTGGPAQSGCLNNGEQGGEGWSDWLALMMTIQPGDQGTDARGIGTYVKGQPTNGPGIRRFPYSTDMNINPQTYGNLALNTEVHAIGEIWCDAIWDMSWFLINQFGFSSDPFNTTAGNNIAMRLVLEGMKLQPCGPGFLDARDAILTADAMLYNNVHRCILWQAFSRRGMGFNASQGSANFAGDETEGFNMPPFCLPPTQAPQAAFTSDVSTVSCGGVVRFTDQSVQAFDWLWDFGDQTTSTLQNPVHIFASPGSYPVKLTVTNPLGSDFVIHTITVTSNFTADITTTPSSICEGQHVNLHAAGSGATNRSYTVESIPYAPLSGTGVTVPLNDDQMSAAKPIGFTFNFFGQDYTNFYICSNGFITFSPGMPPSPVYGQVIPSSNDPDNLIALAWNDLYPPSSGSTVSFFTTGNSPNRKLVVKYNTYHYAIAEPPFTQYPFVVQAILYEGTNNIEIHTTTISDASAFDPAASTTQGVENASGSSGVTVPGRNGTIFSASNDAYRFTQYIPYTYTWFPGGLIGPSQTVFPTVTGSYTVKISDGTACVQTFNSPVINVNSNCLVLNLRVFIEGFYLDEKEMRAVLYSEGLSNDSTATDIITVELHDPQQTNIIVETVNTVLHSNGRAEIVFSHNIFNHSYYIVIRSRNGVETWSKNPVLFNGQVTSFDLAQ